MASSTDIAQRIVAAILAQRLAPGTRLGEQVGQWVATRAFLPLAPAR